MGMSGTTTAAASLTTTSMMLTTVGTTTGHVALNVIAVMVAFLAVLVAASGLRGRRGV